PRRGTVARSRVSSSQILARKASLAIACQPCARIGHTNLRLGCDRRPREMPRSFRQRCAQRPCPRYFAFPTLARTLRTRRRSRRHLGGVGLVSRPPSDSVHQRSRKYTEGAPPAASAERQKFYTSPEESNPRTRGQPFPALSETSIRRT